MKSKFLFFLIILVCILFSPILVEAEENINGWVSRNGEKYYYRNGQMLTGFQEIDGKTYYFGNPSGRILTGWQQLSDGKFYLYEDGTVKEGWQQIGKEKYYVKDHFVLTGFQEIDGKTYYFGNPSGRILTGWQSLSDGKFYLYEDGTVKEGWQQIGKEKYYVRDHFVLTSFHEIDGKTYYFGNPSGRILTGWQSLSDGKFYLYEDGTVKEGWQQIGKEKYYVRDHFVLTGFHEIDGKTYYFGNPSGRILTGWQSLPDGKFYLYEDGTVKEGFQKIDDKIYYVENNFIVRGSKIIDGRLYYFDSKTGALNVGIQTDSNGKKYYLNKNGEFQKGWVEDSGNKYYIGEDGYALTGFHEVDGKIYYFGNPSGRILTGWQSLAEGKFYLYNDGTVKQGWQQIGKEKYYVKDNFVLTGFQEIDGKMYYFGNPSGRMLTGWQQIKEGKFYLYEDGTIKEGWQDIGYEKYYVKDNFILMGFQEIDGKKYLFGNPSGRMLTGWQRLNNVIVYLDLDGVIVTGDKTIESRDYKFDDQGYLEGFKTVDGKMYYYNPDGTLAKGVQRIAGLYYKFNELTGVFEKYVNQRRVIDVSSHQGNIDWNMVKNSGLVDAVILRLGYGTEWIDKKFLRNVAELNRLKIPYSVYLFSYASSSDDARFEARFLVDTIRNNPVNIATDLFSVYYDLENWSIESTGENSYEISQATYGGIIGSFISEVESTLNIKTRVYASKNFIETRFPSEMRQYATWVAQWNNKLTYKGPYEGWQYTNKGYIPGIDGRVDLNIFYY